MPPNLLSFSDTILAALTPVSRLMATRPAAHKRRADEALEEIISWARYVIIRVPLFYVFLILGVVVRSPDNNAKRRKQDGDYNSPSKASVSKTDLSGQVDSCSGMPLRTAINGKATSSNGPNGAVLKKQDPLARLQSTLARARQSVEDIRSQRSDMTLISLNVSYTNNRSTSYDGNASEFLLSRESSPSTRSLRRRWDESMPVTHFDPRTDVDLSIGPFDESNFTSSKIVTESRLPDTSWRHSLPPSFANGAATGALSLSHGSASPVLNRSLASSASSNGSIKKSMTLNTLKERVENAKKILEGVRQGRQSQDGH